MELFVIFSDSVSLHKKYLAAMDKELFNDAIYQIFESWSSLQVSSINNFS